MGMQWILAAGIVLGTMTVGTAPAYAWGADGHRIVAAIAAKLLPPQKAADLNRLLRESDVNRGFIDAASYADEVIRGEDHGSDFDDWHYVNWPVNRDRYAPYCLEMCIIKALDRQIRKASTTTDPEEKALALSWIFHLIGDLHQPLHVGDKGDRGATQFRVKYRGERECGNARQLHLHKVWDNWCCSMARRRGRLLS